MDGGVAVGEGEIFVGVAAVGKGAATAAEGAVVAGEGGVVLDGALLGPPAAGQPTVGFRPRPHAVGEAVVEFQPHGNPGGGARSRQRNGREEKKKPEGR